MTTATIRPTGDPVELTKLQPNVRKGISESARVSRSWQVRTGGQAYSRHKGTNRCDCKDNKDDHFWNGFAYYERRCANRCGWYCKKGMYSHCENGGGWILGNLIEGTQAEYVRIPFADNSLYPIPVGVDEHAIVMLSDILPTGLECGTLNGQVKLGDTVAIVGGGPVGLAALLTAQFYSPAEITMTDVDDNRLEVSKKFGATHIVNNRALVCVEDLRCAVLGDGLFEYLDAEIRGSHREIFR